MVVSPEFSACLLVFDPYLRPLQFESPTSHDHPHLVPKNPRIHYPTYPEKPLLLMRITRTLNSPVCPRVWSGPTADQSRFPTSTPERLSPQLRFKCPSSVLSSFPLSPLHFIL